MDRPIEVTMARILLEAEPPKVPGGSVARREWLNAGLWVLEGMIRGGFDVDRFREELLEGNLGFEISPSTKSRLMFEKELTERDLEVIHLVALGRMSREIAVDLGIKRQTVSNRLTGIYRKLGIRNRTELVRWVLRADRS